MKLTEDARDFSDEWLRFLQQLGVTHLKMGGDRLLDDQGRGAVQPEKLRWAIEQAARYDLKIAVVLLPQPAETQHWNVRLGRPERDAEIEDVRRSLETLGRAGIGVVEYVFNLCATYGIGREKDHFGRGGARLVHFDYGLVKDDPAPSPDEEATAEQMWERLSYFLKRVIPAAEAAGVRLACHPNDPPVPRLRGEDRILGSLEGIRRLLDIVPSEANGLNICIGTMIEMGTDVLEVLREFGSRDRINHIHFRNVRGKVPVYDEVFVDEGDLDMAAAMRVLKEVGYHRTILPDHTPRMIGDSAGGYQARAFAIGYIRGLMQALGVSE